MQQLRPRAARALPNVTQHVSACPLEAHLTLPRTTSKTVRSSPKGCIPSSLQGLHLGLSPKSAQAGLPVLPRHLLAMWPHRADGSSMSQEANLQRGRRQGEPRRSGADRALPKALCPCLPTSSSGGGKARGTPALDQAACPWKSPCLASASPLASREEWQGSEAAPWLCPSIWVSGPTERPWPAWSWDGGLPRA